MTNQRKLCSTTQQNSAICARKGDIILVVNITALKECAMKLEVYIDNFEETFWYVYHLRSNAGNKSSFIYLYE